MNLLKQLLQSKYRNRIENKIRELEIQLLKIKTDKTKHLITTNTEEYVKLFLKEMDLNDDIKLLKELL